MIPRVRLIQFILSTRCLVFLILPPTAGCSRQLLRQRKKEKGELKIF